MQGVICPGVLQSEENKRPPPVHHVIHWFFWLPKEEETLGGWQHFVRVWLLPLTFEETGISSVPSQIRYLAPVSAEAPGVTPHKATTWSAASISSPTETRLSVGLSEHKDVTVVLSTMQLRQTSPCLSGCVWKTPYWDLWHMHVEPSMANTIPKHRTKAPKP